jgi:peptidoglycan/LPS O-acetylase OafA/YrhL
VLTIGAKLDETRGIGQGFDFLRVALATLVVFNHSFLIVEGSYNTVDKYNLWAVFGTTMPVFFALSGFLITGSAQRLKLKDFLLNRSLRIVPALAVDIFVAAIVIGSLVTTDPWHTYFTDSRFFHYFLNIIGFIHYELPGVFISNPFANQVNGSLWTVPFEIGCYAIMSCLILCGAVRSRTGITIAAVVFVAVYYLLYFYFSTHPSPFAAETPVNHYLQNFVSGRGNFLYFYFLAGAIVYNFRYQLLYSGRLALAAGGLILLNGIGVVPLGAAKPLILALPVGYLTAYLGLLPMRKLPLYSRGDYSYGIYLYAYPLQQLLVSRFPGQFSVVPHFILSTMLVTGVAMVSWHCIEKPVLRIRKKFSFTARKGDAVQALPTGGSSP